MQKSLGNEECMSVPYMSVRSEEVSMICTGTVHLSNPTSNGEERVEDVPLDTSTKK